MRKSVFFKLALLILPIVLAYEVAQLYLEYLSIYNATLDSVTKITQSTAQTAASEFMFFDPDNPDDAELFSTQFGDLCERLSVTYLYAEEIDLDAQSEKYLAIGFGDDASDIVKEKRHPGVTVEGFLNEAQLKVSSGEEESMVSHQKTMLDDTLICFRRIDTFLDASSGKIIKHEKPVLIGAEVSFSSLMKRLLRQFNGTAAYDLMFTFLLTVLIFAIFYFKVNGPIKKISKRMENFVNDRGKDVEKLQVKGNDELAEMSRSFNLMTEEIDKYIEDIDALNKEKHTQAAELEIARNIQTGLLKPSDYENGSVCISAMMRAAKNVGGDLYDYQVLENGKVFIAAADVSGKGISAALFMSRAITLLHQYALLGYSPAKMLGEYNNTLAESNPNGLFITTFVAVFDPKTGELTYSNAGHNRPYVISDSLITLDGAAGMAAGIFAGFEYEQETVALKQNDVVFLYTDGVNEAESTSGEQFGTEALENRLEEHIGLQSDNVSGDIFKTIEEFSDGAVQSDDITILTLKVKQLPSYREITVRNHPENLTELNDMINGELRISDEIKAQLLLIAEELFVNICSYAYGGKEGDITVAFETDAENVTLTFTDSGKPFDPTANVVDINDYDHENSIGGLGCFLAFELSDVYSYSYLDGKNILKITKRL